MELLSELFIPYLNKKEDIPQYIQLYRAIERFIVENKLSAGSKLPSTRALSLSLNVSRNTVKSAFELLHSEGYIFTKQGSGSFISDSHQTMTLSDEVSQLYRSNTQDIHFSELMDRLNWQQHLKSKFTNGLLAPSTPAVSEFPWIQWQKAINYAGRVMKHEISSSDLGHADLREQIASYLRVVRGVRCEQHNILVFSGSQQAIYLALQILVNPQQSVLVENPCYVGIEGAINAIGANKIAVEVDELGFNLTDEDASKSHVAVITPSRNYPLGYSLSLKRRMALINWAEQQNGWIIEDDYDSEFRFDGPPLTALQGLSKSDRVIYTGTFSKILHPSIRLGYLVLPDQLVEPFAVAKRLMHGAIPVLPQLALAKFMSTGHFSSHVRRMRKLYSQRKTKLVSLMSAHFQQDLTLINSDGGMHCVYLLDNKISDVELCEIAKPFELSMMPLSTYYSSNANVKNGLVIGFAGYDEMTLAKGVQLLKEAYLELIKNNN